MLQDSSVRKEELRARAKGLKTLGKIFQVQFLLYVSIILCSFMCTLCSVVPWAKLVGLNWVFILQRVKLATEGEPAAMKNTINNSDDNDGSSPDSSPNSPRDQMFDANPPYAQVNI